MPVLILNNIGFWLATGRKAQITLKEPRTLILKPVHHSSSSESAMEAGAVEVACVGE
jgi:hypothetical protein